MKLSLCMIVKNEASRLRDCLESIKAHVDEIVIVDTGSTDGTQEIARQYAHVFDEIEWQGDFSAARNHSMDLATGERIFIMDADEVLSAGGEYLREAAYRENFLCASIALINVIDAGALAGEVVWQARLFRNEPSIRYEFAVHNQIEDNVEAFVKANKDRTWIIDQVDVEILHYGYVLTAEEAAEKYQPRLENLEKCFMEAEDDEKRAYFKFQLAIMTAAGLSARVAMGHFDEIDYSKLNHQNRWLAHFTASRVCLRLDQIAKGLWHCSEMLALPKEPAALMMAGALCLEAGRRVDGLKLLIQAMLDSVYPSPHFRCRLNPRRLADDIVEHLDTEEKLDLIVMDYAGKFAYLRAFQRKLIPTAVIEDIVNE